MRVTFIGHAGLLLETAGGTILCDPWFNPAYFESWYPFPDNSSVADLPGVRAPDYLFVSHQHHDHFDPQFLRDNVSKDATVLLPDFKAPHLRRALEDVGFSKFVETRDCEATDLGGVRILINALTSPMDGPLGDSALAVDDGTAHLFNQNDARPMHPEAIRTFGEYDAHFLQYSGANWFPVVYDFPERLKKTLGKKKRLNGMSRALRYVRQYQARNVFPCAGPPAFVDEELFEFNDLSNEPSSPYPDQLAFLSYLQEQGVDNAHLVIPGTVVELQRGQPADVTHPVPDDEVRAIFERKADYLAAYRERRPPQRAWRSKPHDIDLLSTLQEWWEPLLHDAVAIRSGVNGRLLLETEQEKIVIDFLSGHVERFEGQTCRYAFRIEHALLAECVEQRLPDWINTLFLGNRFTARRDGPYNEFLYVWFKCLDMERLHYVEDFYTALRGPEDFVRAGEYVIQRHCPHLGADLVQFGHVSNGVVTCSMHGWQYELATGRCLTAEEHTLSTRAATADDKMEEVPPADA